MANLLTRLVIGLLKRLIRKSARVRDNEISRNIGVAICILPLMPAALFMAFALFAMNDPDSQDRIVGYLVLVTSIGMLLLSLHYFTYRISITRDGIVAKSLIAPVKRIRFQEPFSLRSLPDDGILVEQKRIRISIGWILDGAQEICRFLIALHPRLVDGKLSSSETPVVTGVSNAAASGLPDSEER